MVARGFDSPGSHGMTNPVMCNAIGTWRFPTMSSFMSTTTPSFDIETVPEHHRQMVADLIPDERIADGYVHRDSLPGVYDFDMLDASMNLRHNVLLVGPTGSAKTTLFRAYCASRRLPL